MQCSFLTQLGGTKRRGSGKHNAPSLRGVHKLQSRTVTDTILVQVALPAQIPELFCPPVVVFAGYERYCVCAG